MKIPDPKWISGFELKPATVAGGPVFLFDFQQGGAPMLAGANWTALRFVIINSGAGALHVTPEASYDGVYVETGSLAPAAFDVAAGTSYGDPYGVDEMRPFWRLSVSGTSEFSWGVMGLPR